ncbi:MAG: SUMF1/EgtB/PvdO family nonheme iron enzyme [Chitinophagaceae bacterium]|nr:SUMF1/EgtB/PvdO family nonheme iron enzyme [Chitinophagaceae bacterium]
MKFILIFGLAISFVFLSFQITGIPYSAVHITDHFDFSSYSEIIPGSSESIKMVPVPGGTFVMGSANDEPDRNANEGPRQLVKVDSFWMGAYEITWDQFQQFMNANLKNKSLKVKGKEIELDAVTSPTPEYIDMSFGMGREGGYPVVNITNYAAIMFAKWLYLKTGHFYRLPTEAEWEYACRAGTTTAYYFGDDSSKLRNYAWFKDNTKDGYSKVGQKKPNALGLYDMLGNVAEWTMDQFERDYFAQLKGNPANNPWFKPTKLYPRSVRGGSWMDKAGNLRCAARMGSSSKWKQLDPQIPKSLWWLTSAPFVGFRLVRPKNTPSINEIKKYWTDKMEDY